MLERRFVPLYDWQHTTKFEPYTPDPVAPEAEEEPEEPKKPKRRRRAKLISVPFSRPIKVEKPEDGGLEETKSPDDLTPPGEITPPNPFSDDEFSTTD